MSQTTQGRVTSESQNIDLHSDKYDLPSRKKTVTEGRFIRPGIRQRF